MKKHNTIVMYSTSWCPDCKRSKMWLDDHKVSYKDINIEEDEAAMEHVLQLNNGMQSTPTIVFPDGSILTEPSNRELEEKVTSLHK